MFLPRKLFQHMLGENAAGGKVHTFLHQVEKVVFSLGTNDGHVGQVDDQFAPSQVLACISPGRAKLSDPGSGEGAFHQQRALRGRIGDGYPEHVAPVPKPLPGTQVPQDLCQSRVPSILAIC